MGGVDEQDVALFESVEDGERDGLHGLDEDGRARPVGGGQQGVQTVGKGLDEGQVGGLPGVVEGIEHHGGGETRSDLDHAAGLLPADDAGQGESIGRNEESIFHKVTVPRSLPEGKGRCRKAAQQIEVVGALRWAAQVEVLPHFFAIAGRCGLARPQALEIEERGIEMPRREGHDSPKVRLPAAQTAQDSRFDKLPVSAGCEEGLEGSHVGRHRERRAARPASVPVREISRKNKSAPPTSPNSPFDTPYPPNHSRAPFFPVRSYPHYDQLTR